MTILIEKQTTPAVSASINVTKPPTPQGSFNAASRSGYHYPIGATVRTTGGDLAEGEYVTLEFHDGEAWRAGNVAGNGGKILDFDNNMYAINSRMTNIRLNKSATNSALGVEIV